MEENTKTRLYELMKRESSLPPVEDYQQITKIVIVPVLEEFVSEIEAGGHAAQVVIDKGVGLVVHPKNSEPSIIRFDLVNGKVQVSVDRVDRGMIDIVSMDPIMVEEHVMAFLEGTF